MDRINLTNQIPSLKTHKLIQQISRRLILNYLIPVPSKKKFIVYRTIQPTNTHHKTAL